jgi:hypothetical protein
MPCSSFEFALSLNSGLVFEFLLDIREKVFLLNARQLLVVYVRTMTNFEPNCFSQTYFFNIILYH